MNILVVDDEAPIRNILQVLLARAGHEVKTAADGFEAVALLATDDFDVLLSDVRMPGMNGHELARFTAANFPETRTILMTGYDAGCQKCAYSPRCTIISKPFLPNQVLDIIDDALENDREVS